MLPTARLAPDSISLEVVFVRQPAIETLRDQALWNEVDEQSLPPNLRRNLAENGLRVGILGAQLPAAVRQLVDSGTTVDLQEGDAAGDGQFSYRNRNMHLRAGRRGKIVAAKTSGLMTVLTCDEGGVRGHSLRDAQCLLGIRAFPQDDGRVRLEISPEIEHGELKSGWVGEEGTLIQKLNKEKMTFDRLKIEAVLSPGQTLLFGATPDVKGLGEHFCAEQAAGGKQRRYLLVRLAQAQGEPLYQPDKTLATLATPGE